MSRSRAPIEPGRDRPWLIVAGALFAAVVAWSWQQEASAPAQRRIHEPPVIDIASGPTGIRPGDFVRYFSGADYPVVAIQKREQGTVSYRVEFNRRGRVKRCTITQSSGSSALDAATCRVIKRRARFDPAPDASGASASISGRIKWVLPEG